MKKQLRVLGLLVLLLGLVIGCSNKEEAVQAEDQEVDNQEDTEEVNEDESDEEAEAEEEDLNENKDYEAVSELDSNFENAQDENGTADEEFKMSDILGTARLVDDEIVYDDELEYFILDLQVGLSNYFGEQDIKNKWMAFAIPDGVSVADTDEIPSGVVVVSLPDGHSGIAVKIPNLKGISSEIKYLEIPLIGEPDDNDPNENLYLFNVDGNEGTAELIGEISSTREIDFSLMK